MKINAKNLIESVNSLDYRTLRNINSASKGKDSVIQRMKLIAAYLENFSEYSFHEFMDCVPSYYENSLIRKNALDDLVKTHSLDTSLFYKDDELLEDNHVALIKLAVNKANKVFCSVSDEFKPEIKKSFNLLAKYCFESPSEGVEKVKNYFVNNLILQKEKKERTDFVGNALTDLDSIQIVGEIRDELKKQGAPENCLDSTALSIAAHDAYSGNPEIIPTIVDLLKRPETEIPKEEIVNCFLSSVVKKKIE